MKKYKCALIIKMPREDGIKELYNALKKSFEKTDGDIIDISQNLILKLNFVFITKLQRGTMEAILFQIMGLLKKERDLKDMDIETEYEIEEIKQE